MGALYTDWWTVTKPARPDLAETPHAADLLSRFATLLGKIVLAGITIAGLILFVRAYIRNGRL